MGNKYYQLIDNNSSSLQTFSTMNMQAKQIMLPSYSNNLQIPRSQSIIKSFRKSKPSYLLVEQVSPTKTYNHLQQLKKLKAMLSPKKKTPQFKVASNQQILKYKKIKDIEHPVLINQQIVNQNYQLKKQPYLINIQKLPYQQSNDMPKTWIYLGQWFQGFPHGIGKLYHTNFNYEGYVCRGIPHLKGRIITIDQVYEGELSMNKRDGFGRLLTKSGYYYQGTWKNNVRVGEGYEIHKNGCVFQGQYKNNNVTKGIFYFPKPQLKKKLNIVENNIYLKSIRNLFKSKYEGNFSKNKFQGDGQFVWSDGRYYSGNWQEGKMSGKGIFTWPNGKRYQGEYSNNQKNGFGKFYTEGKIYQGYWQKGKPNGKGKIIKGNEVAYKLWFDGKIIKQDLQGQAYSVLHHEQQDFSNQIQSQMYSQSSNR